MQNMRRFRHQRGSGVCVENAPVDSADENDNGANNNESGPSGEGSQRKKRGRTQLKRPPNGQQIPIEPLGEE